jgi:hypothetical protein
MIFLLKHEKREFFILGEYELFLPPSLSHVLGDVR